MGFGINLTKVKFWNIFPKNWNRYKPRLFLEFSPRKSQLGSPVEVAQPTVGQNDGKNLFK